MVTAGDIIATCALLFTIASFWLLTARAGNLQIVQGRETRLICCEFISGPYDVVLTTYSGFARIG